MKIEFSPPDISNLEISEVVDALKSGWITTGPKTKELEEKLRSYIKADRVICLNSATAAMESALRLLGIGPGDQVITSAYTYTASASVIEHVGAEIVLVDTLPGSYFMNLDQVEAAITEKTKAIIPVDLAGVPVNIKEIKDLLDEKRALFRPANPLQEQLSRVAIISDAAHALGSSFQGQMVGSIADFTAFSFHAVKNFTTAEGGALAIKHERIDADWAYDQLQLLSLHGQNKDALSKMKLGSWEYDIIGLYYKCNMTDIMAAMGLAQLKRYEGLLKRRQAIIGVYDRAFQASKIQPIQHQGEDYVSNGHLYMVRIEGIKEEKRNQLIEAMAKKGIATNVHYKPLPMMTAYQALGFDIRDFPNSYQQYENEITLPLHTLLRDEEVGYIIDSLKELVHGSIQS